MLLRWQRPRLSFSLCWRETLANHGRVTPKPARSRRATARSLGDHLTGAHGRRRQALSSTSTTTSTAGTPPSRHRPTERNLSHPLPLRAPSTLPAPSTAPATLPSTPIPDPRQQLQPQTWRAHIAERTAPFLHSAPACKAIPLLPSLYLRRNRQRAPFDARAIARVSARSRSVG